MTPLPERLVGLALTSAVVALGGLCIWALEVPWLGLRVALCGSIVGAGFLGAWFLVQKGGDDG